jgi:putative ABC transport system ATP-binding protein
VSVLIRTEELTRIYRTGAAEVRALDGVSMEVMEGEILCIWGRSGSGKTTLLNLLGCLDRPTGGKIFLEEEELTSIPERKLPVIRRRGFGFIFSPFNLIPHLTALENTALPLKYSKIPPKERKTRALKELCRLGLDKRAHFYPRELSGGELQRVSIARALVTRPRIVLADEPTGLLDSRTAADFAVLIRESNKILGQTILIVSHDEIMKGIAHRVLLLRDGRIDGNNRQGDE